MKLNLLVIRSKDPELVKSQYEIFGFVFDFHQHGNGPFHYATENDGVVLEIYPLLKTMEKADESLRLGFEVENLEETMSRIVNSNWIVLSKITAKEWGNTALVQDLDGRKIELKQRDSRWSKLVYNR